MANLDTIVRRGMDTKVHRLTRYLFNPNLRVMCNTARAVDKGDGVLRAPWVEVRPEDVPIEEFCQRCFPTVHLSKEANTAGTDFMTGTHQP